MPRREQPSGEEQAAMRVSVGYAYGGYVPQDDNAVTQVFEIMD